MFLDLIREDILIFLVVYGIVVRVVLLLLIILVNDKDYSDSDFVELVFFFRGSDFRLVFFFGLLEDLKDNMSNDREKLKVDEEDLLNDVKDVNFDLKKKFRVIYNK